MSDEPPVATHDPVAHLPRLLADRAPADGLIKADYDDFRVEERPLYEASGEGTHTYVLIEKRGLSTMQAVSDLARALNVRRRDIGYAGLKDARAVTRQWLSIEHTPPERLADVQIPRLTILHVTRHRNKLRLGHLLGNRFQIRVRHTDVSRLAEFQDGLATLARIGVPNYFGRQRFGGRGDVWQVGRAIVGGRLDHALDILLGRPLPSDRANVRRARELYEKGDYGAAAQAWPHLFRDERRALKALVQTRGSKKRGFLAIDPHLRRFYISAYQSHLFNAVAARRLPVGLGRLQSGDLAWLHASGAVFKVSDAAAEQPRADAFEISPTGPLFGYRMTTPEGEPGDLEAELLREEGLDPSALRSEHLRIKGQRRPLRFQPRDASLRLGADERGPYLEFCFDLPSGCYATSLLREFFDADAEPARRDVEDTDDEG
ncbi:MAG TPA: tRNA pseudouridine(13) synthase TruD [Phycisphaerae bacterium]|nr:tRNA pseudouridine(13) synthase TruD [Phycisphaerae bacterium]